MHYRRRIVLMLSALAMSSASAADKAVLEVFAENMDASHSMPVVQAFLGDLVYLGALLTDAHGQPLSRRGLEVSSRNGNTLLDARPQTDAEGYARFTLLAQKAGADRITVRAEGQARTLEIRVAATTAFRDPRLAEMIGGMPTFKNVIPWERFLAARYTLAPDNASGRAEFPPGLQSLQGREVRLAGFMVPLEPDDKQKRFMLSASPPFCYFHLPGGPATVVEVESLEGIEYDDAVLLLSGKLQLIEQSDNGVFFRLRQARRVNR